MTERRYFCCTDNLTGCKILGAIQLVFSIIAFIFAIVDVASFSAVSVSDVDNENLDNGEATLVTTAWVILLVVLVLTGLWLLVPIMLIVGAVKRNSCLLLTYRILNGLTIPGHAYGLFIAIRALSVVGIFWHLIGISIGLWVTFVAVGAYQDVKNSVHSV